MADVVLTITIPDAQRIFMSGMVKYFYGGPGFPLIQNGVDGAGNPVYLTAAELSAPQVKTLMENAIKKQYIKQLAKLYRTQVNTDTAKITAETESDVFNNAL